MNVNPSLCGKENRRPRIGNCWLTTTWPKVRQRSFGGIVHCKPQIDVLPSMDRAHDFIPHSVASCHTKGGMTVSTTLTKIILTPRGVHLEDILAFSIYNIRYGKCKNCIKTTSKISSRHRKWNRCHMQPAKGVPAFQRTWIRLSHIHIYIPKIAQEATAASLQQGILCRSVVISVHNLYVISF